MATRKVKIKYIKSHDYKVSISNGVFGGLGTNGLINVNFFIDRVIIPTSEMLEIDELGNRLNSSIEKDADAVREIQFGTLLDINTAKLVVEWLSRKISEHDLKVKKP
jgi:hypothetical protein